MTVATNYAKLLKDIGTKRDTQIDLIKEGAREHGTQIIENFFEDLFRDNPKLTHVICTGFTPEWNDGEECFHETQIFIHNDLDGWSEIAEFLECHHNWEYDTEDPSAELRRINANLSPSECRDIEDQIPIDAMSEALGTDWQIIATPGSVELKNFKIGY